MRAGDVLLGRFELLRLAGAGGMARVYRAADRTTGATVAVKMLHTLEPLDVERFEREATMLAELDHPAIVKHVTHGATPEGDVFLVMEWLEGEDLGAKIARGPLDIAECVSIGARVAEALAAAHARGIVHRDVKPSNVFLTRASGTKLLDFGIARRQHTKIRLTRTGMTMGTPGYMSPEQARGEPDIDARSDVFALGCVLYECVTGQPAFTAAHPIAILSRIVFEDPPDPRALRPDAPADLLEVVERMLAKDRDRRPSSSAEIARELDAIAARLGADRNPGRRASPAEPDLPPAIGAAEQRIVSVVVAATGLAAQAAMPTVAAHAIDVDSSAPPPPAQATFVSDLGSASSLLEAARAATSVHGARCELLADGSIVALVRSGDTPAEQAVRAARCAHALRAVLPDVPVLLATGRGVVGERFPVGEVIDRAIEALDPAATGSIRTDAVTAELLGARFVVRRTETAYELGAERSEAVTPWVGLAGAVVLPERKLLCKPTRCVGRERELGVLLETYRASVEQPRASVVLVTGPPGSGKTRLAEELLRRLASEPVQPRVLYARGDPIFAGSAFGLVAPAIRRLAGVLDGEPPNVSAGKLGALIAKRVVPERVEHVAMFLGELVGVPFDDGDLSAARAAVLRAARADATVMSDQVRAAWLEWARAVSAVEPLVIVIEDLHWGDLPTVEILDQCLRALRSAAFFVLALGRPEVRQRFPGLWASRNLLSIELPGLSRRASAELVRDVLGDRATDEVVASIVERAGGNAFYLEELIRHAVERTDGGELPSTVLGMIEARFDALFPETRRALRAASIFGQRFSRAGLARLLGVPSGSRTVIDALEQLADRELIVEEMRADGTEERTFTFTHDLVREAAYATLMADDRALGHRLAGEWLEEVGERDPLVTAGHFERGGDRARARDRWAEAAAQALEASDLGAAVERAERGIACGATGEALGALRLIQAEAHGWKGELEQAERCARAAISALACGSARWFRAVGELVYVAAPLKGRAELGIWAERLNATRPVDRAAALARIVALCRTVVQAELVGEHARAEELVALAEEAVRELPGAADDLVVMARLAQARAFTESGGDRVEQALASHLEAAELFGAAGVVRNRWFSMTQASFLQIELGQYAAAEALLREALASVEAPGIRYLVAMARTNLSYVLLRRGRIDQARETGSQAALCLDELADLRIDAVSRSFLSAILAHGGDLAGAEREARRAAAALSAYPPFCALAFGTLARVLLERDRPHEALDAARSGMTLLEQLGTILTGESILRLSHVRALARTGDHDGARRATVAAARRIDERAASITSPPVRASYLCVEENAELLRLAGR